MAASLFRNFDEHGNRMPRPRTLLIDSEQLESGEALDKNFREHGGGRDRTLPPRDHRAHRRPPPGDNITDQDLLREVMNTVGKPGRLGERSAAWYRCPCSPKAGTPTPSPMSSACAPSAPSFSANRSSGAPCAASPTT
jgi:hypothetical protein